MTWGSPEFLFPYWDDKHVNGDSELPMNYSYGSSEELKSLVHCLHEVVDNAHVDGKYIVFGHGATQILIGLMNVLQSPIYADAPYFSRFPIFADLAGVSWGPGPTSYQLVTFPNNPDGNELYKYRHENNILDLSYNWPQYTYVQLIDSPIMVFSLAKATGHASTRIGWAILKDKELANKLERYVELSTGGLSLDAQEKAINIIQDQLCRDDQVFAYGKKILDKRWERVKTLELPFKINNNKGMFMWCEGICPDELECIQGKEFGSSNNFFRLNLGCSEKIFNKFVRLYARK